MELRGYVMLPKLASCALVGISCICSIAFAEPSKDELSEVMSTINGAYDSLALLAYCNEKALYLQYAQSLQDAVFNYPGIDPQKAPAFLRRIDAMSKDELERMMPGRDTYDSAKLCSSAKAVVKKQMALFDNFVIGR